MASREENNILEALSLKCFGNKYAWRKLSKQGLVVGHDLKTGHVRRIPLTQEQAKLYMIKTLEMQEKLKEELKEKQDAAWSKSNGGSKPE